MNHDLEAAVTLGHKTRPPTSTSGKTYEKTSVIHTRPEQFDVLISSSRPVFFMRVSGETRMPQRTMVTRRFQDYSHGGCQVNGHTRKAVSRNH